MCGLYGVCSLVPPIKCGAEEETSAHIPCECEALASLIHTEWPPKNVYTLYSSISLE